MLWKKWRLIEDRELYNLDADPRQQHNVIGQFSGITQKMRTHLDSWWTGVQDRVNEYPYRR